MTPAKPAAIIPILGLCVLALLVSIYSVLAVIHGVEASDQSEYIWTFGFSLFIAWWVELDRRSYGYAAPFEFPALVFFVWPIVVPYYLYKTRGRRGLLWAAWVMLFFILPFLIALMTYVVLGREL